MEKEIIAIMVFIFLYLQVNEGSEYKYVERAFNTKQSNRVLNKQTCV